MYFTTYYGNLPNKYITSQIEGCGMVAEEEKERSVKHDPPENKFTRWALYFYNFFYFVSFHQEPTDTSKQPIRTRYLGHVTGYQPIRDQYFLIRSVPGFHLLHVD